MTSILLHINGLISAIVLIVAFSLLAYIALHNWRNNAARALCVLLASIVVVYGGDVLIQRASNPETIQFLLRAQWLGIAFIPAAYLHLSSALTMAGAQVTLSQLRMIRIGYLGSVLFFVLALYTDLIVTGGIPDRIVSQFNAGPLFWVYTTLFVGSMLLMLRAIFQARRNALTPTLRRRMTYLAITFAAPGMGTFPYLVLGNIDTLVPQDMILLASAVVSAGMVIALVIMAYSIAFQGMLLPDRLIKYDFSRWALYGPIVGVTIILCIQLVPSLERMVGLPADTLTTFVVMMMTVLMPMLISWVRPYLDALIYRQDRSEIEYLRGLPRNTFTRADLRQLLENTLIAVCGALRVDTGFVISPGKDGFTIKASCGSRPDVKRFVTDHPLTEIVTALDQFPLRQNGMKIASEAFWVCDDFRLLPLRSPEGMFLGALGVAYSPEDSSSEAITPQAHHLIDVLTHQIELALTTVELQQRIFDTLRGLGPEMQSLHQLTTRLEQATPATLSHLETSDIALQPEFPQLVKDALTHYWGGPKLSDSPLLGLHTVRNTLQDNGGSPTRALQTVLRQAINNLRPDDQLDPSAQEWLLYNILELRFLQGKRIRDISQRLAMSESDFYRKQRVAVEEVARQLALMENGEKVNITADTRSE